MIRIGLVAHMPSVVEAPLILVMIIAMQLIVIILTLTKTVIMIYRF